MNMPALTSPIYCIWCHHSFKPTARMPRIYRASDGMASVIVEEDIWFYLAPLLDRMISDFLGPVWVHKYFTWLEMFLLGYLGMQIIFGYVDMQIFSEWYIRKSVSTFFVSFLTLKRQKR